MCLFSHNSVNMWDIFFLKLLLFCRYRSNNLQPPSWSHPDWARPTLLAHHPPLEENCIHATHALPQVSNRRSTDHHPLRCGGEPAEWERTVLQVSQCRSVECSFIIRGINVCSRLLLPASVAPCTVWLCLEISIFYNICVFATWWQQNKQLTIECIDNRELSVDAIVKLP